MALDSSLVISSAIGEGGTGSNVTYVATRREPLGMVRLNTATTLSNPEELVIKHNTSGSEKAKNLTDRHLIQLSRVERDADGLASKLVVNLTIAVPRNGLFTDTEVQTQLKVLNNFVLHGLNVLPAILTNQS